ncbi:trypsin-like peptidase domain-containing protein [Mesobacillus foraminis]|uniref:S1C family serine protease n=1 Tax=Mesobacillus foraminis TaxID=279826 RepID=UPI0039A01E2F
MKKNLIASGLAGLVLGIVLMLFLSPADFNESTEKGNAIKSSDLIEENVKADEVPNNFSIAKAVEVSKDAVVSVVNYQGGDMWEGAEPQPAGSGSGVIYKKEDGEAFIVTNHHVVEGANQIEVTLTNEQNLKAELLGSDPIIDLAVLKVDSSEIDKVISIGDSENLKEGQRAIAIGNPLGFLNGTVTAGVISSSDRIMPIDIDQDGSEDLQSEVLQTDASINPGNSGGALINIRGELIGINSSKIAQDSVEGIGFAIPVDVAMPIMESLEKNGEVKRPYLGIISVSLTDIPSQYHQSTLKLPEKVENGVVIREVEPTSPAAQAGLQSYDVITELDGKTVKDVGTLRSYLFTNKKVGDTMDVTFYRDGKEQTAAVKLTDENY